MDLIKDLIPKTEMPRNIWDINVIQSCKVIRKFSAQNVNTGHYFAAFTLQCRKKIYQKIILKFLTGIYSVPAKAMDGQVFKYIFFDHLKICEFCIKKKKENNRSIIL